MEKPKRAAHSIRLILKLRLGRLVNILPINNALCLGDPFCDYLNITTPKQNQDALMSLILPILDFVGCLHQYEGTYSIPPAFGTFKVYRRGQVAVFSASGGLLRSFRQLGLYDQYLTIFADYEYRISMLHATLDFRVDAPQYIDAIYKMAISGSLNLTRKAIDPKNVTRLTGVNLEGIDTGTVYLGNRSNSDVWAKAYDKRQELLSKGQIDPLPMLRLEIAVQSDVGATLRDASNPYDLFYHFATRSLVTAPAAFKGWEPHGIGFDIERTFSDLTTWQRLWGIIEHSSDFARVIDLAVQDYGHDAEKELTKLLRKRMRLGTGWGLQQE